MTCLNDSNKTEYVVYFSHLASGNIFIVGSLGDKIHIIIFFQRSVMLFGNASNSTSSKCLSQPAGVKVITSFLKKEP